MSDVAPELEIPFFEFMNQVLADQDLPARAFHVAYVIAGKVKEKGHAYMSLGYLAQRLQFHEEGRGVRDLVHALRDRGHIRVTVRPGQTNQFWLLKRAANADGDASKSEQPRHAYAGVDNTKPRHECAGERNEPRHKCAPHPGTNAPPIYELNIDPRSVEGVERLSNVDPLPSVQPNADGDRRSGDAAAAERNRRRSAMEPDAEPSAHDLADASSAGLDDATCRMEWRKFRDHYLANGREQADWHAAWRRWLGKIPEFQASRRRGAGLLRPLPRATQPCRSISPSPAAHPADLLNQDQRRAFAAKLAALGRLGADGPRRDGLVASPPVSEPAHGRPAGDAP
jgi:hypothetical protein